ncbi:MAG: glycine betaine ABC transporter substrate-binding protein [Actinobacteria bacterium]|nr:glycine betaine ABC transporter substrate-binding protein [Actinomycetota bacterium]
MGDDGSVPETTLPASEAETTSPESEDGGTITIGWIAWDECIATSHLWKHILEEEGYRVEMIQLDAAPVYAGLAAGDLDFFTDGWLPTTHEDYWDKHSDSLEDLGTWYDKGTLELTVPSYMTDINSIADLEGKADLFDGRIVGIEPGAGLTRLTLEAVMPGYGLDDYELLEGSTPAMLAELKRAIEREQPIVVTLWRPHWVYAAHDLKDLDDPEGLFGEGDKIHIIARQGFSDDNPAVAGWLSNFKMDDDSLATLSRAVIDEFGEGRETEAIEAWLAEPDNQALVDGWLGR